MHRRQRRDAILTAWPAGSRQNLVASLVLLFPMSVLAFFCAFFFCELWPCFLALCLVKVDRAGTYQTLTWVGAVQPRA